MAFNRNTTFAPSVYTAQQGLANGENVNNGVNNSSHQAFKLPEHIKYFSWGKEPGMVYFNILPFMVKATQKATFLYHVEVHELANPAGGRAHRYICPKNVGKRCSICEQKQALDNGNNYDEIKAYIPKQRTVFLVQPIVNGVPQNEIQFLECARQQKGNAAFPQKLMAMATMMANGQGVIPFADLDVGSVVCVQTVQETFNGHKYLTPATVMFQNRTQPISDEILAKIPDYIEDIFNTSDKDNDEMETLMAGGDIATAAQPAPAPQSTQQYSNNQPQWEPAPAMAPSQPQVPQPTPQSAPVFNPPPTQEQYAYQNGQLPQQSSFQRSAPQPAQEQMPAGPLTVADFDRDLYQAPARSFPSEAPAQAPINNGFVRSRQM